MLASVVLPEQDEPAPGATEYLWPCNLDAWQHWQGVQTQWRIGGMGGLRYGLDYAGVRAYLDEHAVTGDERPNIFAGICAAERATLQVWAAQSREKAARSAQT